MGHVPHLYLPGPWSESRIPLDGIQLNHLTKVLRRVAQSPMSYTNGNGRIGAGTFDGYAVVRGDERDIPKPAPTLCIAVAPPRAKDRVRFLVEKLSELGVDELQWINTDLGQGSPPQSAKAASWAIAALEQSRGAWLMEISGPVDLEDLTGHVVIADVTGGGFVTTAAERYTLVVGPEGGLREVEYSGKAPRISLSDGILRTETAAVVGAAILMKGLDR
ncbi:MAG: RsmE family RNA methyltransferase [Acidimicrobiia bacterium]|nr:RsmE family RNA methyltransferase [Acidimicrobiia bacterium]